MTDGMIYGIQYLTKPIRSLIDNILIANKNDNTIVDVDAMLTTINKSVDDKQQALNAQNKDLLDSFQKYLNMAIDLQNSEWMKEKWRRNQEAIDSLHNHQHKDRWVEDKMAYGNRMRVPIYENVLLKNRNRDTSIDSAIREQYLFDENGYVVGEKTDAKESSKAVDTGVKYSFDANGVVTGDSSKIKEEPKKDEFQIPHYRFDENGVIISE